MLMKRRANNIASEALRQLRSVHSDRLVNYGGLGSDAGVEMLGSRYVAQRVVRKAQRAAYWRCWLLVIPRSVIENSAYKAAVEVVREARNDGFIRLRDGTKSATVALAYSISLRDA
ncbi:MAG: hypothetical protein LBC96_01815 [Lachnospiraceae bacterium]|jgi:hypothetical protein|nr:hypothetical protein [Lachnospiraceae bacterium]